MRVKVHLLTALTKYLPAGTYDGSSMVDIPGGSTIRDLGRSLKIPRDTAYIAMLNGKHSSMDKKLNNGDVVDLFTPIAGG